MGLKSGAVALAHGVENGLQGFCKGVLVLTGATLLVVLTLNVVVRYVLEGSMGDLSEVPSLVFPWFVMGGVVLAGVRGQHVATQFTLHALPPFGRRVLMCVIHAVSAAVFLLLAWHAVENTRIAHDELSTILKVPGSVGYTALLLAFLLLGVSGLTGLVRHSLGGEGVAIDLTADNGGIV